ncbi:MAG TPA: hypothetical protein VD963_10970 [Phycisphaerales bacterium]|nr:hypothetical protein [Phycisphaerales bacterium]
MKSLAIPAMVLVLAGTAAARADTLAQWTFEVSGPALTLNDSAVSPQAPAEGGVFAAGSIASGVHASALTDWSSPAGNGSPESFSSNEWAPGDYYQFQTSSLGYENLVLAWNQNRSGTGPATFDLQYSIDGTNFITVLDDYTVAQVTWSSTTFNPASALGPVALPAGASDAQVLYLRLVNQVAPGGAAGTNRIDNIVLEGTLVPAPGAGALLLAGGLAGLRRRRTR